MLLNLKTLVNYYAKVHKKLRSKDNKKEDSISKVSYSVDCAEKMSNQIIIELKIFELMITN